MNKLERIEEMEKQLSALKAEVESEDKPKRVRVYIKEDAEETCMRNGNGWGDSDGSKGRMVGNVFDVMSDVGGGTLRVWIDDAHSDWWNFAIDAVVIVEGSLEDLK